MPHISLKSILGKRSETTSLLQEWNYAIQCDLAITDAQGNLLFGTSTIGKAEEASIAIEDEIAGRVYSNNMAAPIAGVLTILLKKEAERKKLGSEVLNLYQELNVIYNFSEKLANTIEPDAIAQQTLQQAMHSIPALGGVLVLWNEETRSLEIPAKAGEALFDEEQLRAHFSVLLRISQSGQSQILSDLDILRKNNMIQPAVHTLAYASMKVKQRTMGAIILAHTAVDYFTAAHLKLLVTLALQSSTAIESALLYEKNLREVKEREEAILRIHEITKKFVPSEFIRSLGKETLADVKLGDKVEKIVTVLFTDIRDFTSLSENMTPGENFNFVSSFNKRLGPIIRKHHGFINQYLGDSIMALFPRHPYDALQAAMHMQEAINELNKERQQAGLPLIKAGIGMHTGPLIMGITGDEHRLDAATISDTVNTAARIESLTKHYQSGVLLSSSTFYHLPDTGKFHFRNLGQVLLKGKSNQLNIIECISADDPHAPLWRSLLPHFEEGVLCFEQSQFDRAATLFKIIIQKNPNDQVASILLQKATHYLHHGTPANWNGAIELMQK
jgi:class 3 adenylate cyclase